MTLAELELEPLYTLSKRKKNFFVCPRRIPGLEIVIVDSSGSGVVVVDYVLVLVDCVALRIITIKSQL